jgi:hypothetical protein
MKQANDDMLDGIYRDVEYMVILEDKKDDTLGVCLFISSTNNIDRLLIDYLLKFKQNNGKLPSWYKPGLEIRVIPLTKESLATYVKMPDESVLANG